MFVTSNNEFSLRSDAASPRRLSVAAARTGNPDWGGEIQSLREMSGNFLKFQRTVSFQKRIHVKIDSLAICSNEPDPAPQNLNWVCDRRIWTSETECPQSTVPLDVFSDSTLFR